MNAERGVSQDELLAFIEDQLPGDAAADVERRLGADPELERWARGARADRHALSRLGRSDELAAPRGLWRDALDEAERRALLVSEFGSIDRDEVSPGPHRFRLTPVRLVAAAGFLIVASLGTIAPFLVGQSGSGGAPGNVAGRATPPQSAIADADRDGPDASLSEQLASAERAESATAGEINASESEAGDVRIASARAEDPAPSFLEDKSSLAAGYAPAPPTQSRALLASRWAADPNGIIAGRTTPSPLASHAALGWRNLSVMEPRRRPMPGAFPVSWGMTPASAQDLAAEHRLAALVETSEPAIYLERLLQALGGRAAIVSPGIRRDVNGLSAPVEIVITAPVEKTERALRLCAIGARQVRLASIPRERRPGDWASEALWWAEETAGDGTIRVFVTPD